MTMSHEEIREVVREVLRENRAESMKDVELAVDRGVRHALLTIGLDVSKPIETQQDMRFLRDWRTGTQTLRSRGVVAMIGILVAGTTAAVWVGIKSFLHS